MINYQAGQYPWVRGYINEENTSRMILGNIYSHVLKFQSPFRNINCLTGNGETGRKEIIRKLYDIFKK